MAAYLPSKDQEVEIEGRQRRTSPGLYTTRLNLISATVQVPNAVSKDPRERNGNKGVDGPGPERSP